MEPNRKYLFSLGELIERLSIAQMREIMLKDRDKFTAEIELVCHDIDQIISTENEIKLDAYFLRLVMLTGVLNALIWMYKDQLSEDYNQNLKLSHQLNGLRNKVKNLINYYLDASGARQVTNTEEKDLEFYISI